MISRGLMVAEGHVLLCRSLKGGYSYLPGGHVEWGEPAATALAREFAEETGLQVNVGGLLAVSENAFIQNGKRRHELNLVFHVEHPHSSEHSAACLPGEAALATKTEPGLPDLDPGVHACTPHLPGAPRLPNSGSSDGRKFHVPSLEPDIEYWWCAQIAIGDAGFVPGTLLRWLRTPSRGATAWMGEFE